MLNELSESVASAKDHAIEMLLGQPQLAADFLPVLVIKIEPDQDLPVSCNRHLPEHLPRCRGPLTSRDILPVRVGLRSWKFAKSFGAG